MGFSAEFTPKPTLGGLFRAGSPQLLLCQPRVRGDGCGCTTPGDRGEGLGFPSVFQAGTCSFLSLHLSDASVSCSRLSLEWRQHRAGLALQKGRGRLRVTVSRCICCTRSYSLARISAPGRLLCAFKHSLLPQHPHKLFGKMAQDPDGQRLQESWLALPWQGKVAHFNQDENQERGDGSCWEARKRQIPAQAQGGGQCWQMGDKWGKLRHFSCSQAVTRGWLGTWGGCRGTGG